MDLDDLLYASLVVVSLCMVLSPWIWIMTRRSTAASAWNTRPTDQIQSFVSTVSAAASQAFQAHLHGRAVWLTVLAVVVMIMYLAIVFQSPGQFPELTFTFLCCWVSSAVLLGFAWIRMGQPHGVQPGLLANFFLHGGICGATCAVVANSSMLQGWVGLSPECNPQIMVMTPVCNVMAATMWVLTPGLIEETFKSIWLFFRLRRGPEDLPRTCCFCLPASSGFDCGCWYKLAPTPYHVILCALASGAGFECLENLLYVFVKSGVISFGEEENMENVPAAAFSLLASASVSAYTTTTTTITITTKAPLAPSSLMMVTALARVPTSVMHMVWTGLIGLGLARRLFSPEAERPSLATVLLPSMLAHGLSDYSLTAMAAAAKVQEFMLTSLLFMSFMGISFGSCFVMAQLTGGCGILCCDDSCFCADGFWEETFGPLPPPRQSRQPLVGPAGQNLAPSAPCQSVMENGGIEVSTSPSQSAIENGGVEVTSPVPASSFDIREPVRG